MVRLLDLDAPHPSRVAYPSPDGPDALLGHSLSGPDTSYMGRPVTKLSSLRPSLFLGDETRRTREETRTRRKERKP